MTLARADALSFIPLSHGIISGPETMGSEERWHVRLSDGRFAVAGRLSEELARDEAIRRRYVRDVTRLIELEIDCVAPVLARGPDPDPRDPSAPPPWRVRLDPPGQSLESWLGRAPVPLDEAAQVGASLADALFAVHATGFVLRDVHPRSAVLSPEGRIVFTDIGLARVDVLSSHTASSLLLEGSPYSSPELLYKTIVDQRSDVFGLGVILWRALTGTFPFGEQHALLRERVELPSLRQLRAEVPPVLDELIHRCLAEEPRDRPESASEIAWVLRGGTSLSHRGEERTVCQHCGHALRIGQRLCLSCGRVSVRFVHSPPDTSGSYSLDLVSVSEDADRLRWLRDFVSSISASPVRPPEFLTEASHMYSEDERRARIALPVRMFNDLPRETAVELHGRLEAEGLVARLVGKNTIGGSLGLAGAVVAITAALSVSLFFLGFEVAYGVVAALGVIPLGFSLARAMNALSFKNAPAMYRLRPVPAALPASDPLVARLAALLTDETPTDVREQIGELALLVQRLVDHRAALTHQRREIEAVTAPVEPLVGLIERQVAELVALSAELGQLDEGAMVRALAASEARGDPSSVRESILDGLDRLRTLEDERARGFHRLLEASNLLRRAVTLGLEVQDADRQHQHHVQLALAALDGEA